MTGAEGAAASAVGFASTRTKRRAANPCFTRSLSKLGLPGSTDLATTMTLRVHLDDTLTESERILWGPIVARHYQMTLASCASELRSITLRLGRADGLYRCLLRARTNDGSEIELEGLHAEGETAISHVCARARRALRRRQAYGQRA